MATEPLELRFWRNVRRATHEECWSWAGYTDRQNYGRIGSNGKQIRAHVLSWELATNQAWPAGKVARHTCDNPNCVNPAHIIPGTNAENMRDKMERGRDGGVPAINRRKTNCLRGHPLSGDNLRMAPNGSRQCVTCKRARQMKYNRKARAMAREEARS